MLKQDKKLDAQQIKNVLRDQGRKLGFLIGNSTLPKKVKIELVALIPKMKIEQIERLLNIFEAKYVDEQTQDIDEKYKKRIREIVEDYKKKQGKNDKDFLKHISSIKNL